MTIIVFLMDTSASMYQRTYLGGCPTLLDVAKGAVETFVKVRQRSPESRGDRYMLLTFEEPPANIKAGWKENLATFMSELKNLQCDGFTSLGPALKHTFDVLNINRMQTGIDTYGQGRNPFFLEPSVIIVITDGGRLTSATAVHDDLTLPMYSPIPGSELTREPFRWDQRLFSLVLRLPGTPAAERDGGLVPSDASPIDVMCEVTGGRSYAITSHRMLMQCIDSLVQKVHSGVVINFEKIGPDPLNVEVSGRSESTDDGEGEGKEWERFNAGNNGATAAEGAATGSDPPAEGTTTVSVPVSNAWHSCRRLIYVPRSAQKGFAVGFWPIPENFWPDLNSPQLPPRTAHPNVKFSCLSQEPMVIENLPFDKYELEPSPLTQYVLARKQPTVCWQVFVSNSYKNSDVGHPFGYLKASTNLACVNLFVMPYNYPVLLPLLEDLLKIHRQKPPTEWRALFQNYLRSMPGYYAGPLRRALTRMGVPGMQAVALVPDTLDNSLSYGVSNYLKRLKNQAKVEFERMCNEVGARSASAKQQDGVRVVPRSPLKKDLISNPCLQDKFVSLRDQLNEFGGFAVGIIPPPNKRTRLANTSIYEIPRSSLFSHLAKLRAAFHLDGRNIVEDDGRHNYPVGQMGNYQEHLKRLPPQLREIESTPLRQHMFGNPFKIDKRMMVDEADMDAGGSTNVKRGACALEPVGSGRRRPGPVPRDTIARRPLSRSPSPAPISAPNVSPISTPVPALPRPTPSTPIRSQPNAPPPALAPASAPILAPSPAPAPVQAPVMVPILAPKPTPAPTPALAPAPVPAAVPATAPMPLPTAEPSRPQELKFSLPIRSYKYLTPKTPNITPAAVIQLPNEVTPGDRVVPVINGTSADSDPHNVRAIIRELEDAKHNSKVWGILAKEIRRPGKRNHLLLVVLNTLQGDNQAKHLVVYNAIKEAQRMKRMGLVELMEKFVLDSIAAETESVTDLLPLPPLQNLPTIKLDKLAIAS